MNEGNAALRGTVLLVGASGNLGRACVPVLSEAGWHVRAMSRKPEQLAELVNDRVEPWRGDLCDRASLERAVEGADAVVAAAHAVLGNYGPYRPVTVDRKGHRDLLEVSEAAGVGRFVYISAAGAADDHPVDFFRIKAETREMVRRSRLPHVVLEPGAFMETWADFVGASIVEKGKVVLLGNTTKRVNFVSVRDVAAFVEIALRDETLVGELLPLGGPENLTVEEVVEIYEKAVGRPVRRTRVPGFVFGAARGVARIAAPGVHRLLTMASLPPADADIFDPEPLLRRFPMTLTRVEDVARERVEAARASR